MEIIKKGTKIYKYSSVEDFIRNADDNTIVLSRPSLFNDPFDSNISIDEKEINETIKIVDEFGIFLKILQIKNLPDVFMNVLNNFKIEVIDCGYFKSSNALNTICERIQESCGDLLKQENAKFRNKTIDNLFDLKNKILVSCFSLKNDSLLMWAHYADSHKGVCIEYESSIDDLFYKVNYQESIEHFKLYDLSTRIMAKMLQSNNVQFENDWLIQNYGKPFITKSLEWKYEDEVRCLFYEPLIQSKYPNIKDKEGKNIEGKYLYNVPSRITKVILGCKIEQEDRNRIIKKCDLLGIPIEEMKTSDNQYKLEIKN